MATPRKPELFCSSQTYKSGYQCLIFERMSKIMWMTNTNLLNRIILWETVKKSWIIKNWILSTKFNSGKQNNWNTYFMSICFKWLNSFTYNSKNFWKERTKKPDRIMNKHQKAFQINDALNWKRMWELGTAVKTPIETPTILEEPGFKSRFSFQFQLSGNACTLGGRRWWIKHLVLCQPRGRSGLRSRFLVLSWPNPRGEWSSGWRSLCVLIFVSFCLCLFLSRSLSPFQIKI